jgi:hypothetical protein
LAIALAEAFIALLVALTSIVLSVPGLSGLPVLSGLAVLAVLSALPLFVILS